jgi:hypothetical protein
MGPGLRDDSAEGNAMSNTEKSAGIFGGPSAADKEQMLQKFYGDRLLASTGAGAGLGLGAAALYHLLRGVKPTGKKEKKYPSYGSGTPMIAKEAFAPQQQNPTGFLTQQNKMLDPRDMLGLPKSTVQTTLKQQTGANFLNPFGTPGWALRGAANGIAPNPATQPSSGGILGTSNQGSMQLKLSFDLNSLTQSLGSALPKTMLPFNPNVPGQGPAPSADPYPWRKSWSTAANIGGAALGTYAGSKLINSLVKAKKKRDQAEELEAARQSYYAVLGGKQASALDTAFEHAKQANIVSSTASALWNTPQTMRTAYLLTLLGAGGLGAKYMYDRTKDLTEGENLAKAQASRARTKGLPPVWVDPESLSHIKSTVESNE